MTVLQPFLQHYVSGSRGELHSEEIHYRPFLNRDRHVRIFDEDLRACETLSTLFRLEGFITSFHADKDAFANRSGSRTDVVVANLAPYGRSAASLIESIKHHDRGTIIVAIIEEESVATAVDLMRSGASDVIVKPIDSERLLNSVKSALRRDVQMGVSHDGERTIVVQGFKSLTQRERDVLQLIVDGNSNKSAAQLLGISPRTVEVHRSHVMRKLGAANTADLLRIVLTS